MIRATQPSLIYTRTRPIKLISFLASLILVTINMAINILAVTRYFSLTSTSTTTTVIVYIFTPTSATLLLVAMLYACTGIIALLKSFFTNYRSKTSLSMLVIPISLSYLCLITAFLTSEEMFNQTKTLLIIMCSEVAVLIALTCCVLLIHNIELRLNQTITARAAQNMPLRANIQRHNSSTTIDSGYTSCPSYSSSQSSILYDEMSLSIPPDPHEEHPHIPYIDSFGSQEDMRTAMTTSI